MNIKTLNILGMGDAHKYLKISYTRFNDLILKYKIPYKEISCGRVFLKRDLDDFRKRQKAKHPNRVKKIES